jgi:hypothetical protein
MMSYCRRGPDSDVYMYEVEDAPGEYWIVCDRCCLNRENDEWYTLPKDALAHLEDHRSKGHKVPEAALQRLREEIPLPKPKVKKEGWVNVYRASTEDQRYCGDIYDTEQEARSIGDASKHYFDTIHVEWEE